MTEQQATDSPKRDLEQITSSWFLFLTTFRRNALSMDASVSWTRDKLLGILDEMERAVESDGPLRFALSEAKFPLVYFADEILLNCGWANEAEWERQLLEIEIFRTQNAGQDFFARAEDPNLKDPQVVEIYYKCLCLGFAGQYTDQPMRLREVRENLLRHFPRKQQEGSRFCPEAYHHTDRRNFVKLPMVATVRIVIATAALIGLILFASHWITTETLDGVNVDLDEIQQKNNSGNPWDNLIDRAATPLESDG